LQKHTPIVELKNTIGGIFMGKQFGHIIAEKIFEMKRSGQTHREIAAELGYTHKQIRELVTRESIDNASLLPG